MDFLIIDIIIGDGVIFLGKFWMKYDIKYVFEIMRVFRKKGMVYVVRQKYIVLCK